MFNPNFSDFVYRTRPRTTFTSGNLLIDVAFRERIAPLAREGISEVDYHDDVQRGVVADLRAVGNVVEEHIRLTLKADSSTTWLYDADAMMKASCDEVVNIIEIKTKVDAFSYDDFDGSEFRRKQFKVIIAANIGHLVYSDFLRISNLGLIPKALLPPLGILIIYAIPGQLIRPKYIDPGNFAQLLPLTTMK